jgi:hypothetical protein
MGRDYIPSKDADLVTWSSNFAAVITAAPTSYGLSSGQASAYTTLDTAFATAYEAAINPGTRTPVTVATKDSARNALVANARSLAKIAQGYSGITPELLADAGLTVRDPVPSPIPPPTSMPIISLLTASSLNITLRFKDSVLSNPRSRPDGATSMQLFWTDALTPGADVATYKFAGNATRVPFAVPFESAQAGKVITFRGRWVNAKGQYGPTSDALAATCPA